MDISKRLRDRVEAIPIGLPSDEPMPVLLSDAADEIARLRAALDRIADCSICGYSLSGKETFDETAKLISTLNDHLQRRVKIARDSLNDATAMTKKPDPL